MTAREKIGINDFILECWGIDDTGWTFRLVSDTWWEVVAISDALGTFRATSWKFDDVEEALAVLLGRIKEGKVVNAGNN